MVSFSITTRPLFDILDCWPLPLSWTSVPSWLLWNYVPSWFSFYLCDSYFLIYFADLSFFLRPLMLVWWTPLCFVRRAHPPGGNCLSLIQLSWEPAYYDFPTPPWITDTGNGIWPKPAWWEQGPGNFEPRTEQGELELKKMSQHLAGYTWI